MSSFPLKLKKSFNYIGKTADLVGLNSKIRLIKGWFLIILKQCNVLLILNTLIPYMNI